MVKKNEGPVAKKNSYEPSIALDHPREAIRQIVARYRARNACVIGSVLTGMDTDTSDLSDLFSRHQGVHQMKPFIAFIRGCCVGGFVDAELMSTIFPNCCSGN